MKGLVMLKYFSFCYSIIKIVVGANKKHALGMSWNCQEEYYIENKNEEYSKK